MTGRETVFRRSGVVYKNSLLSIGLVTVPREGSAKDTIAVLSGYEDCIIKALLPSTHVSEWESWSKKELDPDPLIAW